MIDGCENGTGDGTAAACFVGLRTGKKATKSGVVVGVVVEAGVVVEEAKSWVQFDENKAGPSKFGQRVFCGEGKDALRQDREKR
jgi:hypothetical protein